MSSTIPVPVNNLVGAQASLDAVIQVATAAVTDVNALQTSMAAAQADIVSLKGGGVSGTAPVHVVDLATNAALPVGTAATPLYTVTATGTLTVDSQVTTLGQRILVKDQIATQNNGIYKVTTAGAGGVQAVLTRDYDGALVTDYQGGMLIGTGPLGTANPSLLFEQTSAQPATLGTTAITFGLAAAAATAGIGLLLSGSVFSALENAVAGTSIPDDAVAILISAGQWRTLPAATLTANRSKALSMTGATAGKQIVITRLDVSAFTFTVTDAGPGTPTLCIMPAGWVGSARFQSDGTNWFLKEIGALPSSTSTSAASAQFNQASPMYRARGVVLANVANLAAFVVSQNGVTFAQGDIALLANQTTAAECGLYLVGAVAGTAPLTRIAALPTGAVGVNGCIVQVSEGTLHAGSEWKAMATTTGGFVVGTNDPNFYPRVCKGILTLASGTYTLGSAEGLYLFSTTTSVLHANPNTAGGTTTLSITYGSTSASRTAGKSAVAAATVLARVAAGTIQNLDNTTVDWSVTNW